MELLMIFVWLLMAVIGASMAEKRNRSRWAGFALGGLLGLIGLAVIALMGKKESA